MEAGKQGLKSLSVALSKIRRGLDPKCCGSASNLSAQKIKQPYRTKPHLWQPCFKESSVVVLEYRPVPRDDVDYDVQDMLSVSSG